MSDHLAIAWNRTVSPQCEPITLADAKEHLRLDDSYDFENELLADLIAQAAEYCEEQTEASLISSVWELKLDRFPCGSDSLTLGRWPLISLDSIAYKDTAGADQTLDLDTVSIRRERFGRSRLSRVNYQSWPSVKRTPDAVTITITAGYGTEPASVPPIFRRAMLLLIGHWFQYREAVVVGKATNELPLGVARALAQVTPADNFGGTDLSPVGS